MISKNKLKVEIKPEIKSNIPFASGDVLFDWTPFEIPLGAASLIDISGTMNGTNGASQAGELFSLIFAKPIDFEAPPSLGTVNGPITAANAVLSRKHIIGYHNVDMGEKADTTFDTMVSYNMFGANYAEANIVPHRNLVVLNGDKIQTTTPGYQTIYVAAAAESAIDFGTGVLVNGAHDAADTTIVVDGTDATLVFAPGDIIYGVNVSGATVGTNMEVVTAEALLVTVEEGGTGKRTPSVPAITTDFEIAHAFPMVLKLGLEY